MRTALGCVGIRSSPEALVASWAVTKEGEGRVILTGRDILGRWASTFSERGLEFLVRDVFTRFFVGEELVLGGLNKGDERERGLSEAMDSN